MQVSQDPVLVSVAGPSPGTVVVSNAGPSTVYYAASQAAAKALNVANSGAGAVGSVAPGASVTLSASTWLICLKLSSASLDVQQVPSLLASTGHVIEDEGTPLTARSNLNFTGVGVTATDAGGKTVVTIPGAAAGALPSNVLPKTANFTAATGDFIQADATAAGFTVTLPTSPAVGALVTVKKTDATVNAVLVAPAGGGTIDGDAVGASITLAQDGVIVEHLGTNAWTIASRTFAGSGVPDASITVKGVTKLATAPASAANPIAVGDNDPRNTNARTPTAHTHPVADLGTGTPASGKYLDGAGAWTTLPAGGAAPIARIAASPAVRAGRQLVADFGDQPRTAALFDLEGTNAVQTLSVTGTPTGGSFTLTGLGVTVTVPWNATALQVQALLQQIYGGSNVACTGGALPGSNVVITWQGDYKATNVATLTAVSAGLTGGTTPAAALAVTTTGGGGWVYATDAADSSRPVIKPADWLKDALLRAKPAYSFRDSETYVRLRIPVGGVHSSNTVKVLGRYLASNENSYTQKVFNAANPVISTQHLAGGADRQVSQVDITDGIWHCRYRIIGPVAWAKWWRETLASSVYTVTIGGVPTGGTFTLTYGGQVTTGLAFNAAASAVQTALQALSSIGAGNATVTGAAGGPYTVTFAGTLANTVTTALTGSAAGLTGGTPTLTIAQTVYGSTGAEPDWQIVKLPNINPGDWVESGPPAFYSSFADQLYLTDFTITELLPAGESVVFNGDYQILDDATSFPVGWAKNADTANAKTEFIDIADPDGVVRRFCHLQRNVTLEGAPGLTQRLYVTGFPGRTRAFGAAVPSWAQAIEIGLTHKATSLRHGGVATFLGAAISIYYNDIKTVGLNVAHEGLAARSDYYAGWGPTGVVGGSGASGGLGTWGWIRETRRIPLMPLGRVAYLDLNIEIHDNDILGDWWFGDITVRPVA